MKFSNGLKSLMCSRQRPGNVFTRAGMNIRYRRSVLSGHLRHRGESHGKLAGFSLTSAIGSVYFLERKPKVHGLDERLRRESFVEIGLVVVEYAIIIATVTISTAESDKTICHELLQCDMTCWARSFQKTQEHVPDHDHLPLALFLLFEFREYLEEKGISDGTLFVSLSTGALRMSAVGFKSS